MNPIVITVPPDLWQRVRHDLERAGLTLTAATGTLTGTQRFVLGVAPADVHPTADTALSDRETQVLARVAAGMWAHHQLRRLRRSMRRHHNSPRGN